MTTHQLSEELDQEGGHVTLIADAGYSSIANLEAYEERKLNAYISTSRQKHSHRSWPSRGRAPRHLDARGRMVRMLRSVAGQAIFGLPKSLVEPVFGQIKEARPLNRFRLLGLKKVNREWSLMDSSHNILKFQGIAGDGLSGKEAWVSDPRMDRSCTSAIRAQAPMGGRFLKHCFLKFSLRQKLF